LRNFFIRRKKGRMKIHVSGLLLVLLARNLFAGELDLQLPKPGDYQLRILTPNMLELVRINSKQPDPAHVDSWDWIDSQGAFSPPNLSSIQVLVNGQTMSVSAVGFKRRPVYAPQATRDLRIANSLFLQLNASVAQGQSVQVLNDGTLWPTNMNFSAVADPLRFSPAIHVNQEGYLPAFPKKARIGYFVGDLGELPIVTNKFLLIDAQTGAAVFQGALTARLDFGYTFTPTPYQNVYEADFSGFMTPGNYRVAVPGMGASLTFRINEGMGMNFARTYALGMFHQRSGYSVAMPFTRFTHAADHLDLAIVPTNDSAPFAFTWATVSNYAINIDPDNAPQIAPLLTNSSAQRFPFVNSSPVESSGGHFEAGDYNRVSYNSAQLIHTLMFAVDAIPGVAALDNLGIPESGDGIGDILQEAKWEADFLAKMQDSDGGFYYSVYPQDREYEYDRLPENGDPQVVWPKNTAATAAAVAALAQCSSSPRFKQAFPQAATDYLAKAQLGWKFLTNAIAQFGDAGAYQRVQHFGDSFMHRDEMAWAACELFLATGNSQYHTNLLSYLPDPTDPGTTHWGWWRMYASFGNAIRSYATAVTSGRVNANQIDANYLAKCVTEITNCGNDNLQWSQDNAYGSSFPEPTKHVRGAGWYFSAVQAFDIVVAQQFNPNPAYVDAILANLNYEAGCNPINVPFVTGLGWNRQREIVDQYSNNDKHALPKIGMPTSNLQEGFVWTFTYGWELSSLSYPSDGAETLPYAPYDRWCDLFNVTTEASTTDVARSLVVAAWLAAQTSLTNQSWRSTNAVILAPTFAQLPNQPVTVALQVADTNLSAARITWEAQNQEPIFGNQSYTFTPSSGDGTYWIEAEVQWPDGRRAFATNAILVSASAPPQLTAPQQTAGGFTFQLSGQPSATYIIQASPDLISWHPFSTNTLPSNGTAQVSDSQAASFATRYFRAVKMQ
jgi:hypothetical protein